MESHVHEVTTVMTIEQAAVELEDHGHVQMTAVHRQVAQAQSYIGPVASMQQVFQSPHIHLVGQPLVGDPAVPGPVAAELSLSIQGVLRPAPDRTGPSGHVLCHGPGVQAIGIKSNQGTTGEYLGP